MQTLKFYVQKQICIFLDGSGILLVICVVDLMLHHTETITDKPLTNDYTPYHINGQILAISYFGPKFTITRPLFEQLCDLSFNRFIHQSTLIRCCRESRSPYGKMLMFCLLIV